MDFVIQTKGLTKAFGNQLGVDHVDLHVKPHEIYGLLGRNGAGKTTSMRMILGLSRPSLGEIELFGKDYRKNREQTYHRIGSLIEAPGFYENLTAEENLLIHAKLRGTQKKDAIANALRVVNLDKEKEKTFGHFSLGMKQRLSIAAAIMHEPELLILDEPINGLDPVGIHEIRNYLETLCHEKGTTIFISSHILSEIEQLADTIGVLHEGRLIEEISMKQLHLNNRQFVEYIVSEPARACLLLEEKFGLNDYSVHEDNAIRIYNHFAERGNINRAFVNDGIDVTTIHLSEEKLEDYFSELIGGGEIG